MGNNESLIMTNSIVTDKFSNDEINNIVDYWKHYASSPSTANHNSISDILNKKVKFNTSVDFRNNFHVIGFDYYVKNINRDKLISLMHNINSELSIHYTEDDMPIDNSYNHLRAVHPVTYEVLINDVWICIDFYISITKITISYRSSANHYLHTIFNNLSNTADLVEKNYFDDLINVMGLLNQCFD